jgi:hypothetical protein
MTSPDGLVRYTVTEHHFDPMHASKAFDIYLAPRRRRPHLQAAGGSSKSP